MTTRYVQLGDTGNWIKQEFREGVWVEIADIALAAEMCNHYTEEFLQRQANGQTGGKVGKKIPNGPWDAQ
jgi:hypothetical protein